MESASFTFLIFYPSIFQHRQRFSISSTNFFLSHLNNLCSLLLSDNRGMSDKCSGTCIVCSAAVAESLCSHFQQSCKKKEIIPSSVNSWHTRSRRFPNHHATSSRTHTKHYSFTSSVIYHLAPASEEMVITLENLGNAFLGSI